jgi:hypothetical protein
MEQKDWCRQDQRGVDILRPAYNLDKMGEIIIPSRVAPENLRRSARVDYDSAIGETTSGGNIYNEVG